MRKRKIADNLLIALFLTVLFVPLLATPLRVWRRIGSKGWARYYENNYGLRDTLIGWNGIVRVRWLGISPSTRVVIGRDGWLYYADGSHQENYPSSYEIEWRNRFLANYNWLAERHIRYLLVIAPDKHTIYPEHLPTRWRDYYHATFTDNLLQDLEAHTDIDVVDLRPALIAQKSSGLLYYPTDTHWNEAGAWLGYAVTAQHLARHFPALKPMQESDIVRTMAPAEGGDLADFVGLKKVIRNDVPRLSLKRPHWHYVTALAPKYQQARYRIDNIETESSRHEIASALVVRDSFYAAMLPFMAEHFGHGTYIYSFDKPEIERQKPAVVIQEMVERDLY